MEIIRMGQSPEDKEYEVKCYNCSTMFKFKESEAKKESGFRNDTYLIIYCPVCNQRVCKEI
jgi:hypothetical protein